MEDQRILPNDKEWECLLIANECRALVKSAYISKVNTLQEKIDSERELSPTKPQEGSRLELNLLSDELEISMSKSKIKQIRTSYKKEDILVSSNKFFSQLWSDFGMQHFYTYQCSLVLIEKRAKEECIQKWVNILYPVSIDIKKILLDISISQSEHRRNGLKQGIRINTGDPVDCISNEIDKMYGKYC